MESLQLSCIDQHTFLKVVADQLHIYKRATTTVLAHVEDTVQQT